MPFIAWAPKGSKKEEEEEKGRASCVTTAVADQSQSDFLYPMAPTSVGRPAGWPAGRAAPPFLPDNRTSLDQF